MTTRVFAARLFHGASGRTLLVGLPLSWIIVFFVIPFLIILKISLSESIYGAPPFTPLLNWVSHTAVTVQINFYNYLFLLQDNLYILAFLNSLLLAGVATLLCLFIGYPMAYGIARCSRQWQIIFLLMVILPFWISFLIRIYAWIGILSPHGLLNNFLIYVGVINRPLMLLHTKFAVGLGMVYSYLPFMILPLYTTLEKMDGRLLEAAADLGARPFRIFRKITLPLSTRGIVAGSMLVFIPSVGEFVIPEILGGSDSLMIGRILWMEFFNNQDWPVACAIAIALLVLLLLPMIIFQRLQMQRRHW